VTREGHHYPDPPEPEQGAGRVGPTPPVVLAAAAVVGLALGGAVRPVARAIGVEPPLVSTVQVGALFFVAAVVGGVAILTWRTLQRGRGHLEPHRAVNRLVLAKSCALVGALVAGGYAGYAVVFLDRLEAPLGRDRVVGSVLGAVAGVAIVIAALLLERACRARGDEDPT